MHDGITLTARNASLMDLQAVLKDQRARSLDVVAGASKFRARDGMIVVSGAEQVMDETGITDPNGTYLPTEVADEGLGEKLGIPRAYMRLMRDQRPDLWDANVNGWLHGAAGDADAAFGWLADNPGEDPADCPVRDVPGYEKPLMLRILRGDTSGGGVLRAVLSDRFARIDNLDVLVAALSGVRDAGLGGQVTSCDLSERRMYVVIESPEIRAMAPALLAGYRNPFDNGIERWREVANREGLGYEPGTEPVVHAGLVISNSEVGNGSFTVTPRFVFQICRNGLRITADMLRKVHLGEQMDEGVIQWSTSTQRKALELVASKTQDAVAAFLSPAYIEAQVGKLEELAGAPVKNPAETIQVIAKAAAFPTELADNILAAFIAGGQLTAGGVMQAVTAVAQTVEDADLAALLESEAVPVLAHAARIG